MFVMSLFCFKSTKNCPLPSDTVLHLWADGHYNRPTPPCPPCPKCTGTLKRTDENTTNHISTPDSMHPPAFPTLDKFKVRGSIL
jgi:hypothetical protein